MILRSWAAAYNVVMRKRIAVLAIALVPAASGAEGLVALIDPLDEPQGYCVDVPGWGSRLNLDAPLMAHTCKPGAADELFTPGHPEDGQLYMRAYDRCAQAASARPGAEVFMKECGTSGLQRFLFESDGRIRLADGAVCLAVADGEGRPTGGPSHLRRDLALEACDTVDPARSKWKLPGFNRSRTVP